MENSETLVWINFALSCGYINTETNNLLSQKAEEIGRILNFMINHSEKFI